MLLIESRYFVGIIFTHSSYTKKIIPSIRVTNARAFKRIALEKKKHLVRLFSTLTFLFVLLTHSRSSVLSVARILSCLDRGDTSTWSRCF